MDKETKMMFNTILEEMGRMEERINRRFDAVDRRFERIENELEQMHHEINACASQSIRREKIKKYEIMPKVLEKATDI